MRGINLKGHYLNRGWQIVPGVTGANKYLKWPHMFFVTLRHWKN